MYQVFVAGAGNSWYVGLLAVALVVFSIGVYVGIRTYLKLSLQSALSRTAHTIADDFLAKLPSKGESWVLGEVRESYEASPSDHYVSAVGRCMCSFRPRTCAIPSIPLEDVRASRCVQNTAAFHRQVIGHLVMIYSLPYQRDRRPHC